jgi:uncharacterized membrane protein SpoIIM required for sporulation/ABC-type transport system involved in multi-copper enzyme maturation permease subunit
MLLAAQTIQRSTMSVRLEPVFILTKREIRDQFRDWRVIFPVVVLTLIFPVLMKFTASQALGFVQKYDATIIAQRLFPFLMMVVGFFPITVSLVIALESFVGEKERRSLEPLLSSPLSDWQIYLGKLLAALLVPTLASYLGTSVYLVWIWRELSWAPSAELLVLILMLVAVQALVMVSGAVVISSLTTSVRAANLLASFIIIPMALLMQGESIAMFWGYTDVLWGAAAVQLVVAILLIRMGIANFNREELLGREIDALNPRLWWQIFKAAFRGEAGNLRAWLQYEIPATLKRIGLPLTVSALLLVSGLLVGAYISQIALWPGEDISRQSLSQNLSNIQTSGGLLPGGSIALLWLHNIRAIFLSTLAAIFSFGALGMLVLMLPLALIGYFTGSAAAAGLSPGLFLSAFLIPHGLLELPAILLSGAVILRLGASFAAPAKDKTISETWLAALADWLKIMLVFVIPLLLGAAVLEVWVTPRLALVLLGS